MPNLTLEEDKTAVGALGDKMVYPGIDSCVAITLVCNQALIGHHLVQFNVNNEPYTTRLAGICDAMNQIATGRTITHVVLAGALDMYPASFPGDVNGGVNGARPATGLVTENTTDHGTVNIEVTRNTIEVYSRNAAGTNNTRLANHNY